VLFGRSQSFSQLHVSGLWTLFLVHCTADLVRGHARRTCALHWGLIYGGVPPHNKFQNTHLIAVDEIIKVGTVFFIVISSVFYQSFPKIEEFILLF
jgi:hypothetical protein